MLHLQADIPGAELVQLPLQGRPPGPGSLPVLPAPGAVVHPGLLLHEAAGRGEVRLASSWRRVTIAARTGAQHGVITRQEAEVSLVVLNWYRGRLDCGRGPGAAVEAVEEGLQVFCP